MIYRSDTSAAGFTQIQNNILESPQLSAKAKGLLCYLLSKPKTWKVNINDLIARNADGRDGIIAGIDELVKQRYVIKKVFRVSGRFESEYDVYDYPQPEDQTGKTGTEKPERKNRNGKTGTEKPERQNRDGKTVPENPVDSNTNFSNTNFSNTDISNTHFTNTENQTADKPALDLGKEKEPAKNKKNKKNGSQDSAQNLPVVPEGLTALIDQIRAEMKDAKTPEDKNKLAADLAKYKAKLPVMFPFETPEFIEAWNDWKIHYAKKVRNKGGAVYNTNTAEQKALITLNNLAKGIQENAIALIYHAIEKNWQGFYPINDNNTLQNGKGFTAEQTSDAANFAGFGRTLI